MGNIKKVVLFMAMIMSFDFLCSCSSHTASKNKSLKIGVTLYKQDDVFITSVAKSLDEYVQKKESSTKTRINMDIEYAEESTIEQENQVDKFIKQKCNVICVNMVDRTEASVIIQKCKKAGIPIIFFNREPVEEDMNMWNKLYYVGGMSKQSGELQAQIMIDKYRKNKSYVDKNGDGKIQYVMLEGEQEHQDSILRTEYCIKTINSSGIELEKLGDENANWQSLQAYGKMVKWINKYGDKIEVVFCNNDSMAIGAISAIEASGIERTKRPLVIGIDGIPEAVKAVNEGKMEGTVINDDRKQAKAIIDMSYDLYTSKSFDHDVKLRNCKYVEIPHSIYVRKTNK